MGNHANKKGVRYRYYKSVKDKERLSLPVWRIPAGDLEGLVMHQLTLCADHETQPTPQDLRSMVERVTVHSDQVEIVLAEADSVPIIVPAKLIRRSGEKRIAVTDPVQDRARPDAALIKLIVRAFQARQALDTASNTLATAAVSLGVSAAYFSVLLRLSYLAPDIVMAILDGRQPATLNRQRLARVANLPMDWQEQRSLLG